ncbi:MAG: DUF559 domain-containing protein [Candidatus Nomurabacteria bacterium]|nr:DUF559 domain-containing protein [Candidatus Nomurabacteria bacterium]
MTEIFNTKITRENRRNLRKNMTEEERILWVQIRDNKLGVKFRRQVGVGNYIVDFYCIEKNLVVELDGSQHLENKEYDKDREVFMDSLGLKTLRFWNQDVRKNLNGVLDIIRKSLN